MRSPRDLVAWYGPSVRSAVLTTGAVIGSLCLLATVVAPLLGVRPLIFLSGSMSPAIPAGSLALARDTAADDLEVGDIVTVPTHGTYVTHRIVEVTHAPGHATMLLRGDGNAVADATVYEVASAPRTFFSVPGVGRVVAWFSHAPGVYVLAGWVALVIGSLRRTKETPNGRPARPRRPYVGRPKLVLVLGRLRRRLERQPSRRRVVVPALVALAVAAPVAATSPALAALVHHGGHVAAETTSPLVWGEGLVQRVGSVDLQARAERIERAERRAERTARAEARAARVARAERIARAEARAARVARAAKAVPAAKPEPSKKPEAPTTGPDAPRR